MVVVIVAVNSPSISGVVENIFCDGCDVVVCAVTVFATSVAVDEDDVFLGGVRDSSCCDGGDDDKFAIMFDVALCFDCCVEDENDVFDTRELRFFMLLCVVAFSSDTELSCFIILNGLEGKKKIYILSDLCPKSKLIKIKYTSWLHIND